MTPNTTGGGHAQCSSLLIDDLRRQNAILAPSATAETIAFYEQELGFSLPSELVELLRNCNGAQGPDGTPWLWSIEQMRARNRDMRADKALRSKYMTFDHLLFFGDLPDGDLAAFPITKRAIGTTVTRWCSMYDNRRSSFTCLRHHFADGHHLLACSERNECDGPLQYERVSLSRLLPVLDEHYDLRPPTKPERIAQVEKGLGFALPGALRELCLAANGIDYFGPLIVTVSELAAFNHERRVECDNAGMYTPLDSLLIFGAEGNGDLYGFPIIDGKPGERVFEWDHETDQRMIRSDDLLSFLMGEVELSFDHDWEEDEG